MNLHVLCTNRIYRPSNRSVFEIGGGPHDGAFSVAANRLHACTRPPCNAGATRRQQPQLIAGA